ncbi:MAG: hypothetical protein AAB420_03885 [Patescibacteria group bacterium]
MRSLLYIFNGRFPTEKAHGIQIAKMCEAYTRAGMQVTLMVPWQRNLLDLGMYGLKQPFSIKRVWALDPAWLWNMSQRTGTFVRTISGMLGIVFSLAEADVVYTRDYTTLILLALFGRNPVVEIHDYRLSHRSVLLAWALKKARAIICNSEGTKSLLTTHYPPRRLRVGAPTEASGLSSILVVPNGVDVDFFDIPETREEARKKLKLPQDKIIIGYVGSMEVAGREKGVATLRGAFDCMKSREKAELTLVISVPYTQVPLYLRAIDIAVIPYPGDQHARTTSPMKLFEYQAARKTIVVADSPDPQRLAEKLDEAIMHPHPYDGELYTWEARASRIMQEVGYTVPEEVEIED